MGDLRLSGLASGMDTDAMVESMMKVERMKVDRVEQDKQISMWRQEAYNDTNKSFANFILNTKKDMGLNKTSSTGVITSNSYKNLDYVRKVTSSDETTISASTTSKAVNGSYSVEVDKLAKGASFASANMEGKEASLVGGMTFKINGADITVGESGDTITMSDVVKAINSATYEEGKAVTAFYDKTNERLFMQTKDLGIDAKIDLEAGTDSGGFISALGYEVSLDEADKEINMAGGDGAKYTKAQDAEITFNGVTLKYDTNNINLNGINMELKSPGSTEIKVDTNIDGMMEKIQKFVEDYNKLVEDTSKSLTEKRYREYHPLSQEEKKAMNEDDVKLWTEKSKSGMLNGDETINRTMQNIRTHLYKEVEGVEGSFKQITEIGITTEKYSRGTAGGKLEINEEKLREALEKDPEGVMELLFKDGKFDSDGKEIVDNPKNTSMGVFTGIYEGLTGGMKSIIDKSGTGENESLYRGVKSNLLLDFVTKKSSISDIDKAILDMDKKIDDLNRMLDRKEEAHYAKFANMEKNLQKMNSQSDWLAQQFA